MPCEYSKIFQIRSSGVIESLKGRSLYNVLSHEFQGYLNTKEWQDAMVQSRKMNCYIEIIKDLKWGDVLALKQNCVM